METTIKERLIMLSAALGMSVRRFETSIGASNGWVNHLGDRLSAEKMEKICLVYPFVNKQWLLTGIGEIILQSPDVNSQISEEKLKNCDMEPNDNRSLYQKLVDVMEQQIEYLRQEKRDFLAKYGCTSYSELEAKMKELQNHKNSMA